MAYYCIVTATAQTSPSRIKVDYQLRNDNTTPHTTVSSGTLGFEMLAFDALAPDGLTPLTAQQRRQYIRDQVEEHFRALIKRVRGADADMTAVLGNLVGFRIP